MFDTINRLIQPKNDCTLICAVKEDDEGKDVCYFGLGNVKQPKTGTFILKLIKNGYKVNTDPVPIGSSKWLSVFEMNGRVKHAIADVSMLSYKDFEVLNPEPLEEGDGFCIMLGCTPAVEPNCPLGNHPQCDCSGDPTGPPACKPFV